VFLDWKQPVDAGRIIVYKIQRRNRTEGAWQDVATAIETESTLVDQPKGAELEYRAMAINLVPENPLSWFRNRGKSGEGQPSNTVMVVL
jgi:hypothetical protein